MNRRAMVMMAIVGLAGTFAASGVEAQERTLPDRLGPATRDTLDRLIDSAGTAGLPRKPLIDKVAEGVLKSADDERILRAVRSLARELGAASAVLGPPSDPATLGAAASALHAGVSPGDLARLARPAGGAPEPATLAAALVTLVDLLAKHVPSGVAIGSIQAMLERRATDRQFAALRNDVGQDILAGRAPEASLVARARAQTP